MRKLFSAFLMATLSLLLLGAPLMAAPASSPSAPLGVVVSAENANVGAGVTTSGATIYDGDHLQTPENASLRIRFEAGQLLLRQSSIVDIHALTNGFAANLGAGTVVASSTEGRTFQVIADGATVRPANTKPASVQVRMVSATEAVITSTRGTLEVSMGDEVKTVDPGESYRMEVVSADSGPGPDPQSPHPTARNRFLWILIPTVAAVTGIVVWRALVSPTAP